MYKLWETIDASSNYHIQQTYQSPLKKKKKNILQQKQI